MPPQRNPQAILKQVALPVRTEAGKGRGRQVIDAGAEHRLSLEIEQAFAELKPRCDRVDYSLLAAFFTISSLGVFLLWRAALPEPGVLLLLSILLTVGIPLAAFNLRNALLRRSSRRLRALIDQLHQPRHLAMLFSVIDRTNESRAARTFQPSVEAAYSRILDQATGDETYLEMAPEVRARLLGLLDVAEQGTRNSHSAERHRTELTSVLLRFLATLRSDAALAEVRPRVERLAKWRPRSAVKKWRVAETEREVVRLEGSLCSIFTR